MGRKRKDLRRANANPSAAPSSRLAGYSGTPLPKKLGIKPDSTTALVGAPQGFRKTLGGLPEGARLQNEFRGEEDLAIWFVRSRAELTRGMKPMAGRRDQGKLWIAWPKKTSKLTADLGEADVREAGLAAGLVDFKVCAIDADWSGLLFTRRKAKS